MTLREQIVALLLLLGALVALLAAIGIVRMPDLFTRMSATSKAGTLAKMLVLMAVAAHFDQLGVTTRALAIFAFLLLTTPIAAHRIGRAARASGVPMLEGTLDEMRATPEEDPELDDERPHSR